MSGEAERMGRGWARRYVESAAREIKSGNVEGAINHLKDAIDESLDRGSIAARNHWVDHVSKLTEVRDNIDRYYQVLNQFMNDRPTDADPRGGRVYEDAGLIFDLDYGGLRTEWANHFRDSGMKYPVLDERGVIQFFESMNYIVEVYLEPVSVDYCKSALVTVRGFDQVTGFESMKAAIEYITEFLQRQSIDGLGRPPLPLTPRAWAAPAEVADEMMKFSQYLG